MVKLVARHTKQPVSEINRTIAPKALTPEAREDQLIARAIDLAEQQLIDGTASSQVIVHYLKLGSTRERKEQAILAENEKLLKAKTEALETAKRTEELYAEALKAMRAYSGGG